MEGPTHFCYNESENRLETDGILAGEEHYLTDKIGVSFKEAV